VTAADVATAYGEQFDAGKASAPGGQSSCLFVQSGGGVDQVGLLISQGADAAIYYTTNKGGYPGTDVAGLGDKGFVSTDGGMVGTQRGSVAVLVHLVGFTNVAPAALQTKQETFARLVLSRIK
jgi:hypothetical protein